MSSRLFIAMHKVPLPGRIVVLIGGNGSNLQSLIDYAPENSYQIVGVISHKPDVFGLTRAAQANIPTAVVDHKQYADRPSFEQALTDAIQSYQPDLVVLAGFMRILSAQFVEQYATRILNIHPALLPNYKGLNTHQRVIENGDDRHGATVHFVTAELDGGPLVAQAQITLQYPTSIELVQAQVLKAEHWVYPMVVNWYCSGRLKFSQNQVVLDNQLIPPTGIVFNFKDAKDLET